MEVEYTFIKCKSYTGHCPYTGPQDSEGYPPKNEIGRFSNTLTLKAHASFSLMCVDFRLPEPATELKLAPQDFTIKPDKYFSTCSGYGCAHYYKTGEMITVSYNKTLDPDEYLTFSADGSEFYNIGDTSCELKIVCPTTLRVDIANKPK